MADVSEPTIPGLVGQRVRGIRVANGYSQDELADAARRAGLDWTRATVAALETGRRSLSAEEFLLLPLALVALDAKEHTLAELLQGAPTVVRPTGIPAGTGFLQRLVKGGGAQAAGARERQIAGGVGVTNASGDSPGVIDFMAAREAERHAAEVLKTTPRRIARAAWRQWRRGFTEERDRRVDERASEDVSTRSRQAIRGHVTRELLQELRPAIRGGRGGRR